MKQFAALAFVAAVAFPPGAGAQERGAGAGIAAKIESTFEYIAGDPAVGPVVRNAPYSGEATTTVSQTLADGTRIERTTVVRVYRDNDGRVRREQTVLGLEQLAPSVGERPIITITDPVAGTTYVLNPSDHTARRAAGSVVMRTPEGGFVNFQMAKKIPAVGEPAPPPPPPPPPPGVVASGMRARGSLLANEAQPLGTRQMEGIEVVGTKRVEVIPAGRIGNDRPIEITDERWESPVLHVLVQSRHSDPRTGIIEYRLANISRAEPPHDLFVLPPDYTILGARDR